MKKKNLCSKRVTKDNAYEIWEGFGLEKGKKWYVLQKFQNDEEHLPGSKWLCYVESKGGGIVEEVGMWDVKRYSRLVKSRLPVIKRERDPGIWRLSRKEEKSSDIA
jgi:hypothetical protein